MGKAGQVLPLLILLVASIVEPVLAEDRMERARIEMVDEIVSMSAMVDVGAGRRQFSTPLLDVLRRLPRHRFVPVDLSGRAYDNRPLPIGHGQTISQPYIVALMTDLLELRPGQSVLEIGTGSGYQAAVLAEMETKVFSIEIIEPHLAVEVFDKAPEEQAAVGSRRRVRVDFNAPPGLFTRD